MGDHALVLVQHGDNDGVRQGDIVVGHQRLARAPEGVPGGGGAPAAAADHHPSARPGGDERHPAAVRAGLATAPRKRHHDAR